MEGTKQNTRTDKNITLNVFKRKKIIDKLPLVFIFFSPFREYMYVAKIDMFKIWAIQVFLQQYLNAEI